MQSNIEMMNFVVRLLNANLPSYYYYHNYEHTLYVLEKALEIGLEENCTDGENTKWVEAAHMLKGSAGNIGATALHALSAEAQNMQSATAQERSTMLDAIHAAYTALLAEFDRNGLIRADAA